ncbi:hypothetical protein FA13DRAFT_1796887 [Coprinellus micaceus]|uniref:F-box domain-containing protein n=1 Tax=Coprinellus micaceus TaxID=71717 RepID=A0A4Y7SSL9_COPMI|nr:hypothetical protein FA13DRAFT_1796887 [Coprinellus micaceus]
MRLHAKQFFNFLTLTIFPNEILELIIEELAVAGKGPWTGLLRDVKSCCLVSQAFVPLCRKHIFRSIDLHPGRTSLSGTIYTPDIARLWGKLLYGCRNREVHPGIYVRKLKYRPAGDQDRGSQLVLDALQGMPNVSEVELIGNRHGNSDFLACSLGWRLSILCLIQQPNLKVLTIRNMTFPVEALQWCPALGTLNLLESWSPGLFRPRVDLVGSEWRPLTRFEHAEPDVQHVYPRVMVTDSMSAVDIGVLPKLGNREPSPKIVRLDRVEHLHLVVEGPYDYDVACSAFQDAKSLRKLSLQMNVEPDEQTHLPEFPLAVLHPDSFLTLTYLHLNVMMTREWENTPLADPYLGLCEKALRNLIVLQELKVNICIADIIALPDTAYGPQWGKLDRALASDETTAGLALFTACFDRLTAYICGKVVQKSSYLLAKRQIDRPSEPDQGTSHGASSW